MSALHTADGPGGGPGGPGGGSGGSPGSDIAPSPARHGSGGPGGAGGSPNSDIAPSPTRHGPGGLGGSPGSDIAPSPARHGSPGGGSNASSASSGSSTASAPAASGGGAQDTSGIAAAFEAIASFFGFHISQPGAAAQATAPADVPKPAKNTTAAAGTQASDAGSQAASLPKKALPAGNGGKSQENKAAPTPDTVVKSVMSGVSKIIHSVVH